MALKGRNASQGSTALLAPLRCCLAIQDGLSLEAAHLNAKYAPPDTFAKDPLPKMDLVPQLQKNAPRALFAQLEARSLLNAPTVE
jgi:hypothetical protein